MSSELQNSIIDAINILVDEKLGRTKYTASNVGKVLYANGFDCLVEVQGSEVNCVLMEHLHDWIQKDDIVIIQDLYNDSTKKAIIGKIGSSRATSFTIFSTEKGKSISGVDALINEKTGEILDVIMDIEK